MRHLYIDKFILSVAIVFAGCTQPPIYSTEYNLDFEYTKNDSVPTKWTLRNFSFTGYDLVLDRQIKRHGRMSLRAQWQEQPATVASWGGFQNFLPGELVAGKELEISGWVKTKDSVNICAGYGIFSYVPGKTPMDFLSGIDTIGGIRGTSDWIRYTTRQKIDDDASCALIAGFISGKGTAWFDDMEIRIDGRKYDDREIPLISELSDADKRELHRYVYPLRTCESDGGDAQDLDILRQLVGECRVVGLGEDTHGTSEIYKLKNRMIRYLAENEGFDTFALEANMPESYRMNDYTVGGEGDPKRLIQGMYVWPWWTEEMLSLAEWMKDYNASKPKIVFTGVDMQMYPTLMKNLQLRLAGCPGARRTAATIAGELQRICPKPYEVDPQLAEKLDGDLRRLAADREIASLPEEEKAWALQYIDMLRQYLSQRYDWDWRDRGMAENMAWIMNRRPTSKAVLWAHNQHINLREGAVKLIRPMGFYLKEHFGDGYCSVGFVCYEGTYTAWKNGLRAFDLPVPASGTLEYVLGQLDEPLFILDLKKMREENSPVSLWLDDLEFREIGATPEIFYQAGVSEAFDYLIFIRKTSASHILKF